MTWQKEKNTLNIREVYYAPKICSPLPIHFLSCRTSVQSVSLEFSFFLFLSFAFLQTSNWLKNLKSFSITGTGGTGKSRENKVWWSKFPNSWKKKIMLLWRPPQPQAEDYFSLILQVMGNITWYIKISKKFINKHSRQWKCFRLRSVLHSSKIIELKTSQIRYLRYE